MRRYLYSLVVTIFISAMPAAGAAEPAADFARANELASRGDLREALPIYEMLTEQHPDNADYLTELGRTQLQLKRALPASRSLQEAIAADRQHEPAYQLLLQAYLASGQSERAYGILQEAREQFGERPWMEKL